MKSKSLIVAAGAVAVLGVAQMASAHPGHGTNTGFAAGIAHPLSGPDHILAMIAVGLCAAQIGGKALWTLPATFLAFMVAGGALAIHGTHVPMIEQGIAASVLVLGLIIAGGSRLAVPFTTVLVALFALFHGYAHGAEMTAGLGPVEYGMGFLVATALLLALGSAIGFALKRKGLPTIARVMGGAIACCGILLLAM